jgi:hypothetical protein
MPVDQWQLCDAASKGGTATQLNQAAQRARMVCTLQGANCTAWTNARQCFGKADCLFCARAREFVGGARDAVTDLADGVPTAPPLVCAAPDRAVAWALWPTRPAAPHNAVAGAFVDIWTAVLAAFQNKDCLDWHALVVESSDPRSPVSAQTVSPGAPYTGATKI